MKILLIILGAIIGSVIGFVILYYITFFWVGLIHGIRRQIRGDYKKK